MNGALRKRLATAVAAGCTAIIPDRRQEWAKAMVSEVEAIDRPGAALAYALGCLATCSMERIRGGGPEIGRETMKDSESLLAWTGAALILAGAFLPASFAQLVGRSADIDRTFTLFEVGGSPLFGILVVAVGLAAAILAWRGRTAHLIWCGIAVLGVLAAAFPRARHPISLANVDQMNPSTVSFGSSWGLLVLLVGAAAMLAAGAMRSRRTS